MAAFWLQLVGQVRREKLDKCFGSKYVAMGESSPEKAGVGGSTPSLATMFSSTYSLPANPPCPKLSHKTNWLANGVASQRPTSSSQLV
jgi:hypothetical protein